MYDYLSFNNTLLAKYTAFVKQKYKTASPSQQEKIYQRYDR